MLSVLHISMWALKTNSCKLTPARTVVEEQLWNLGVVSKSFHMHLQYDTQSFNSPMLTILNKSYGHQEL